MIRARILLCCLTLLAACGETDGVSSRLPPRGEALTTRLALVVLEDLGDPVFLEPDLMWNFRECGERGAAGPLPGVELDLGLGAAAPGLEELIGPGGLRATAYGPARRLENWTLIASERRASFEAEIFERLDRDAWDLFLARLRPPRDSGEPGAILFEPGRRAPSARGFALSALDHELRRLILQVGSHLTLVVVRQGETRADWTISGPGSDDLAVLEEMKKGRVGRALARLLGFAID